MSSTADSEAILHAVLDGWKAGVDTHEPEWVAARFTTDAIFQGLHPYSVGRRGIAAYDESQPLGLTAQYQILETRRLADDLVLDYQNVEFGFADRPPLAVRPLPVAEAPDGRLVYRPLPGLPPALTAAAPFDGQWRPMRAAHCEAIGAFAADSRLCGTSWTVQADTSSTRCTEAGPFHRCPHAPGQTCA
ncbi:MAG: hypothetical protein QOF44_6036 [Streptomyces sp.]|nr:hypothetical protein [Streptomyces sp.]